MKFLFVTLLSLTIALPLLASAVEIFDTPEFLKEGIGGGLCKGVVESGGKLSLGCKLCDLIVYADRLIKFMAYFALAAAAIFFLYAGYLTMYGGYSSESLTLAKNVARGTVVGLLIVLTSWIVINTIFQKLVNQGTHKGMVPPWQKIECK